MKRLRNLFRRQKPQIFFVAHNRNHVRMFDEACKMLKQQGVKTHFCIPPTSVQQENAIAELRRRGQSWSQTSGFAEQSVRGDLVVVGIDQGAKLFCDAIKSFQSKGIKTVGVVEGGRFTRDGVFKSVQKVLVWGNSGQRVFGDRAIVCGSPVIEAMPRNSQINGIPSGALINFKFGPREMGSGQDHRWLQNAIRACRDAGFDPVVSQHPGMADRLAGLEVSYENVEKLIHENAVLISRASTTIYQALFYGTQPFLVPTETEDIAEFDKPMGGYPIIGSSAGLRDRLMSWKRGHDIYDGTRFLNEHVSFDPHFKASDRIAAALMSML